ncbi:Pept_C1 domain-containing protein [Meloidogyne graminicola]|uniref:Pept_C1 domain-containing protein n=1 Tax=Meloidogyne graminicola TaxID=189291 RepID=A0A8S9ZPH6_9BILA|nr:Pept_C1 domain-containing protein [Meloidogyne graminicola]
MFKILSFNFLLFSVASAGLLDLDIVTKLVDKINKNAAGVWTAEANLLSLLPLEQQKMRCGAKIPEKENHTQAEPLKLETKPGCQCTTKIDFDARTKWPGCSPIIGHIQNQGQCGSCWGVSTASAYSDRYCIARTKKGQNTAGNDASFQFSALDIISCSINYDGCLGGWPYGAWQWIQNKGICTGTDYNWKSGCKPYPFPPNNMGPHAPKCSQSCSVNWKTHYSNDKHLGKSAGRLTGSTATIQSIQREIQTNGPVVGVFDVYSDFMSYKSGKTQNAQHVGGHAIRIIGWGTQTCLNQKIDFWLCANSWGTGWGEGGYFKIRRGVNECGIDKTEISYGIPKIIYIIIYLDIILIENYLI